MKYILYILIALTLISPAVAQQTIYVGPGSNLFITAGTSLSTDSLVLTPSANFNITPTNGITKNNSLTHISPNTFIGRVFHFANTAAPFTGTIAIYYLDAELKGLPENELTLNIHNGSNWTAFNSNVTRDAVNNVVTTTNISAVPLNELTLASVLAPLPIRFLSVSATCKTDGVLIGWKTAQESNSKLFEVQASADGTTWNMIGTTPAAGNSSTVREYSFLHTTVTTDNFYRIVERDLDDRTTISALVRSSCSSGTQFSIYPNPVVSSAFINLHLDQAGPINLRLYDARGALVKTMQKSLQRGANLVQVNMQGLASGWYTLTATWNGNTRQLKISKQ